MTREEYDKRLQRDEQDKIDGISRAAVVTPEDDAFFAAKDQFNPGWQQQQQQEQQQAPGMGGKGKKYSKPQQNPGGQTQGPASLGGWQPPPPMISKGEDDQQAYTTGDQPNNFFGALL